MKILVIFSLLIASLSAQTVKLDKLTIGSREFTNLEITKIDGQRAKILHDDGVSRVPMANLPKDLRARLVPAKVEAKPEAKPVELKYQIINQKEIPNGGFVRLIVINPKLSTENGLRDLVEILRKLSEKDRNVSNFIFDDVKAAKMMQDNKMDNLPDDESEFYDLHFKVVYRKNVNTNFHRATIYPQGLSGRQIDIDF